MSLSKRNVFTTVTPLPASLTRKTVLDFFHNHEAMIDLNPLVVKRHKIKAPESASADEAACIWYQLTDQVHYLPGGIASGNVVYTACFNDLPTGVQTHCRAPAGVDIRSIWSLRGSLPGEPKEPMELGLTVPKEGLYIREDVDLKCNFILSSFVKKTLKKAHSVLVDRLMALAERKEMDKAISEQFPMNNAAAAAAPTQAPGHPSAAVNPAGAMPTHPAYMQHPHNPQYPPTGQYPPSMAGSDPRMSDPRMSMYSSPDPRQSYQSTQSWSSYGTQPGLAPPNYGHQQYNYYPGGPAGPAASPSQMGFEYEQAMKRASGNSAPNSQMGFEYEQSMKPTWNPQTGWYQPTMQPVEIASSDYMMPTDEKKKVEDKKEDKKDENKADADKKDQKKEDARQDKMLEAYPQPVRSNTFEMM